jgi:hypothetical protein
MGILVDLYEYHSENFVDFHLEAGMVLGDLDLLDCVLSVVEHGDEDAALAVG